VSASEPRGTASAAAAGWSRPRRIRICPSILSADFARLREEIARVERAGADFIHVDVMDGQFVPSITFGPIVVEAIRHMTRLPLDVHLMIVDPLRHVEAFAKAGADHVIVHVEAMGGDPVAAARVIRAFGIRAGFAIKPKTPLEALLAALPHCDIALVMTVEPGAGGQAFLEGSPGRIAAVRAAIDAGAHDCLLEADGGISTSTGGKAVASGADTLVAGHSIFRTRDAAVALRTLRAAIDSS
jgi:ribulose-phosphate 3-epimerase